MAINKDRFRDGAGVLGTYEFEINHLTESGPGLTQNLQRSTVTAGGAYVRQQGDPSPGEGTWSGTILTQAQHDAMTLYYKACAGIDTFSRTVFLRDFTLVEYEVLITTWNPVRVAVAWNNRDPVNAPFHIFTYDMTFEVFA